MTATRKKVAVLTAGVVGTGEHSQGIPALVDCLHALALQNDITIYSLLKANKEHIPPGIRMRETPLRTRFQYANLFLLGLLLVLDHLGNRYDLIHAIAGQPFGSIGVFLGRLLRIPSLVMLHGGELAKIPDISFGDLRNPNWIRRLTKTCQHADVLVALSRFQALGLSEVGISPGRAIVIPFGVDTSRFPYTERPLNAPYQFLHVSYAQPVKDVATLLKSFGMISAIVDSRLVIVGQNHIGQETQRLVDEYSLGTCVELVGSVRNEQISEYLSRAHFILLTSRYESQAVVLSEAMSAGVVVCATRVGLAFDLGDELCILAGTGDSKGLADKVIAVIKDAGEYARLRSSGRRWCELHDAKWTAAEYRKIYERF